jgi:hypothetical protein
VKFEPTNIPGSTLQSSLETRERQGNIPLLSRAARQSKPRASVINEPTFMTNSEDGSQSIGLSAHGPARLPDDEFGSILAASAAEYAGFAGLTDS